MEPKHMSVKCTVSMLQNAVEEGRPIKLNSEVKEVKKETSDADMSPWERLK
jgi:macrodomain Ter protein organizer (MatP/YcbG family)